MLSAALGLPVTAVAQRVSLTPIAGVYLPLKAQSDGRQGDVCEGPCPEALWSTKLEPGPALGVKFAMEWDGLIGIEASIATAATARRRITSSNSDYEPPEPATSSAQTTVTAVRMTVTRPLLARATITLGGGFALNHLSGSSYDTGDPLEDLSLMGLTLAAAFRVNVAASTRFELGLASSFYLVEGEASPGFPSSEFRQHDLIISAGLAVALRK